METQTKVIKGDFVQVFINKWVSAYVLVDYTDYFYALCPRGIEKKFMYEEENKTWRIK